MSKYKLFIIFILLLVSCLLLGQTLPVVINKESKAKLSFAPNNNKGKVFDIVNTRQFGVLHSLYSARDKKLKWSFNDKLYNTKYPSGALAKFTPENSIDGVIRFYNDQLWLGIFDKEITRFLIYYIDDGFDGFIYEGEKEDLNGKLSGEGGKGDGIIDRIAIMVPNNTIIFIPFERADTFTFNLPQENGKEFTFSKEKYREYFSLTYTLLQKENKEFTPFPNTEPIDPLFKNYQTFVKSKK